jgi:hypothetical protein
MIRRELIDTRREIQQVETGILTSEPRIGRNLNPAGPSPDESAIHTCVRGRQTGVCRFRNWRADADRRKQQ